MQTLTLVGLDVYISICVTSGNYWNSLCYHFLIRVIKLQHPISWSMWN